MKRIFWALVIALIGLVMIWPSTEVDAAWYDNSWLYRVKITIDSTQVNSDLDNFPVYVDLADLPSDFFSNVESDGSDIRVTAADGSSEVPREVVAIDTGAQTGELHFLASGTGGVSSSSDTDFYIYYGNSSASEPAVTDTYGRNAVWSDYVGVWHFNEASVATSTTLGESGAVTVNDSLNWQTVTFSNSYASTPVVFVTPVTAANCEQGACSGNNSTGGLYPVPVVRNVTSSDFEISMCVDGGAATCDSTVLGETFHWFAFDPSETGSLNWIEVGTTSSVATNGTTTSTTFANTMGGVPAVWTQAQTYSQGGEIGAVAWVNDTQSTTGFDMIGCVHTGTGDSCDTNNSAETFGYVAIDLSAAVFDSGNNFQSNSTSISNSLWTAVTFPLTYTTPRVMVTQNDDNGGQDPQYAWARNLTASGMDFRYCEQDAATVCNSHTGEVTNWFALEDGSISTGSIGGDVVDSTGNGYEAVVKGDPVVASGQMSGGYDFDGISDYLSIRDLNYTGTNNLNQVSMSAWISSTDPGPTSILDYDRSEYFSLGIDFTNVCGGGSGLISFATASGTDGIQDQCSVTAVNNGAWRHVGGVFDQAATSDKVVYVDGVADNTVDQHTTGLGTGTGRFGFIAEGSEAGAFDGGGNNVQFDGIIDEVRLREDALSADWFDAEYTNQNSSTTFYTVGEQIINDQLSADIVDGSGNPVSSPSVSFNATVASFNDAVTSATLGTSSQKLRVINDTINPSWTMAVAATDGSTALWGGSGDNYDFNDPNGTSDGPDGDSLGGQLSINPSVSTITPESGCTNTGVNSGSAADFEEGAVDSITIASASSGADFNCYWDITGVDLSQDVPQEQPSGNYNLNLTVTVTAL